MKKDEIVILVICALLGILFINSLITDRKLEDLENRIEVIEEKLGITK